MTKHLSRKLLEKWIKAELEATKDYSTKAPIQKLKFYLEEGQFDAACACAAKSHSPTCKKVSPTNRQPGENL